MKLWIDDQLDDPNTPSRHTPEGFEGARSSDEAKEIIRRQGLPEFMDLDHDLGGDDTVMHFLRWLADAYPNGPIPQYKIHSRNGEGSKNIDSFLKSWATVVPWKTFTISQDEGSKIENFQNTHSHNGAKFTYAFTRTSLGTLINCRCSCGKSVNVASYRVV